MCSFALVWFLFWFPFGSVSVHLDGFWFVFFSFFLSLLLVSFGLLPTCPPAPALPSIVTLCHPPCFLVSFKPKAVLSSQTVSEHLSLSMCMPLCEQTSHHPLWFDPFPSAQSDLLTPPSLFSSFPPPFPSLRLGFTSFFLSPFLVGTGGRWGLLYPRSKWVFFVGGGVVSFPP